MTEKEQPAWVKKQETAPDFETERVPHWDGMRDKMDPGCYVLIRIYPDEKEIGVGVCDYQNVLLREFRGKRPADLYHAIFDYAEKNGKKWFTKMDHAAYLGKELQKAAFALEHGTAYEQE